MTVSSASIAASAVGLIVTVPVVAPAAIETVVATPAKSVPEVAVPVTPNPMLSGASAG